MRQKQAFRLWKRGKYYYYRLPDISQQWITTGKTSKTEAQRYVIQLIKKGEVKKSNLSFKEFSEPFFLWESCPHIRRLLDEGKSITQRKANNQRGWLKKYIFADPIAKMRFTEITRADLIDFRSRLFNKLGEKRNTFNKVMGVVKTIYKEALHREEISNDPTAGIGIIKEYRKKPGTFTEKELKNLFPQRKLLPWEDLRDYACFFTAATTGMRRGELLVLKWKYIDFEKRVIEVQEAWKGGVGVGTPKWDHRRVTPLPSRTVDVLANLFDESVRTNPDDLVFCYDDGSMLSETWWLKRFNKAMKNAGIDRKGRNLKPHSFRHNLNSILRGKGYDDNKIQAALGWQDEKTQDGYTTWDVEALRGQADLIDGIWDK